MTRKIPDPGAPPGFFGQVLVPGWPAPAGVRALCSTRLGGVSAAPWDSLNLGAHVGDSPAAVSRNRALWAARLGARPVFLQQVHGTRVLRLEDVGTPAQGRGGVAPGDAGLGMDAPAADACVTDLFALACTMMVADCLPVLLCDTRGGRVGAAHAGWRGLAGVDSPQGSGVLEAIALHFDPAHTLAWLGPCIGPQAFEVGGEVKAAFERHALARGGTLPEGLFVSTQGKWLADLPGLARHRLAALGITRVYGNDGSPAWCTVTNSSLFFSHRRDGRCGRLAASIWLG